jgi:MoaA/NifB/PqqE/SkfB family radical SAM enzyme
MEHTDTNGHEGNGRRKDWTLEALAWGARGIGAVPPIRKMAFRYLENKMRAKAARPESWVRQPRAVAEDKLALTLAVLNLAEKALTEHRMSDASLRGLIDRVVMDIFVRRGDQGAKDKFRRKYGMSPPDFLAISPGKACNLRCVGCYANAGPAKEKLDWATFEQIVTETKAQWGTRFFVITGGEPLAYKDDGKTVLDLAERHQDCFFQLYTNGTLIDDKVAKRLGELGNVTPGISVEGMREPTDARRGAGVFDKVVAALQRLRREGVIYGISLTATRENCAEAFSEEFVKYFFEELGVYYAWVFHYMPIGRSFTLDLMLTPEQRLTLYDRIWHLVRDRRLFIADFWNSGVASNGCLAAGRPGGYMHVNWNGDVSPCVFVPYSAVNVREAFAKKQTMSDIWAHPFFAEMRVWQREYGFREVGEVRSKTDNWLMPCPIRDHHGDFRELVVKYNAKPTDDDAKAALADEQYHEGMCKFGHDLGTLTDPIWQGQYEDSPPSVELRAPSPGAGAPGSLPHQG